jgi:hypothetical protein
VLWQGYIVNVIQSAAFSTGCFSIILRVFRAVTGYELMPGVMAVTQTFEDRINFHPHIHILATEGSEYF